MSTLSGFPGNVVRAEDFFLLGWADRKFRKPPYPDMGYTEAIQTAALIFWNIGSLDAQKLYWELLEAKVALQEENANFPGRSRLNVKDFNDLWRGRVTTLLTWFKKKVGK